MGSSTMFNVVMLLGDGRPGDWERSKGLMVAWLET